MQTTNIALSADEAEMLLFAFDADLDTQLDVLPFGAADRESEGVEGAGRQPD